MYAMQTKYPHYKSSMRDNKLIHPAYSHPFHPDAHDIYFSASRALLFGKLCSLATYTASLLSMPCCLVFR